MRRFSARNHLVTLNDINITPLLDLAFVLLIIFVITTPLLEQSIKLTLPQGGSVDVRPKKEDLRTVEVSLQGFYVMAGQRVTLDQIEAELVRAYQTNPKLAVYIRADGQEHLKNVTAVVDRCVRNGISKFAIATQLDK